MLQLQSRVVYGITCHPELRAIIPCALLFWHGLRFHVFCYFYSLFSLHFFVVWHHLRFRGFLFIWILWNSAKYSRVLLECVCKRYMVVYNVPVYSKSGFCSWFKMRHRFEQKNVPTTWLPVSGSMNLFLSANLIWFSDSEKKTMRNRDSLWCSALKSLGSFVDRTFNNSQLCLHLSSNIDLLLSLKKTVNYFYLLTQ